jgi:hypothetical protein
MAIFYSATNNAFYDTNINQLPPDSIEIDGELHIGLLRKQSNGFIIKPGDDGKPVVIKDNENLEML